MNVVLWIVQGVLALVLLVTGGTKAITPREALAERMGWARDFSAWQIKTIGALEMMGALGLVVPGTMRVAPLLTIAAAACVAVLMAAAASVHLRRREPPSPPIVLALLALFVVAGRLAALSMATAHGTSEDKTPSRLTLDVSS